MIQVRESQKRGHFNYGWLDTFHTFSFEDYQHKDYGGFRTLRVVNEDQVLPGEGFRSHAHRDMEIITYVLEGALEHQDSMGNTSVIRPGEVQRMSAGTGVTHSEFNPSKKEIVHLFQIWISPNQSGLKPSYEQRQFSEESKTNRWCLVASGNLHQEAVKIHQNVEAFAALLGPGKPLEYRLNSGRHAWVQIARGAVTLNGKRLSQGDGASLSQESHFTVEALMPSEILLFDLH